MKVTTEQLQRISKGKPKADNVKSVILALNDYGKQAGLDLPHRLAQFIPQLAHESGGFIYDKEIASGAAYEGRVKGLGNTQKGDGKKFKGRGPIQITGRANYTAFTKWVRRFIPDAPDFTVTPELINTDPYEGLSAIWFWDSGNSTKKSLNRYADQNNPEMITRVINGGLNGYDDRLDYIERTSLVLLEYPLKGRPAFQIFAKKKGWYDGNLDGEPGPQTRAAYHRALVALTNPQKMPDDVKASPIVEEKEVIVEKKVTVEKKVDVPVEVETPVVVSPKSLDKPFYKDPDFIEKVGTGGFLTTMTGFFTNIPTDKLLIMVGILLAGGVIWYVMRNRKIQHLEERAAVIDAKAEVTRAAIAKDQP